ncbi:MAG: hypothetical protein C4521_04885 [Actinobacteria bacterium]|nr:MAG: hypothetical protein C4521_04885 [Actinomycetota bacterium]
MTKDDLPPVEEVPAAHLEGRELGNGWSVGARITKDPGATGGCFSISYLAVHEDGTEAFMKALNFHAAVGPGPVVDRLKDFTSAFVFERDLLADCGDRKMSHIIKMIDNGQLTVPQAGPLLSEVPYLIFELADGDIRAFQARSSELDCAWAFRVMKHSLEGLGQLHASHAAHQDLKPSNVLTQDNGMEMKLGDLGRAERRGVDGPCSELPIPGAVTYAPTEQLYGAFDRSWEQRRAGDLYLAGSLGAQLFVGHCMSALILTELSPEFRPDHWTGTYGGVLPYLGNAHNAAIAMIEQVVAEKAGEKQTAEQFATAIAQMTNPDLDRRGHPRDRAAATSSFWVQRYVSLMDLLSQRAHYRSFRERLRG